MWLWRRQKREVTHFRHNTPTTPTDVNECGAVTEQNLQNDLGCFLNISVTSVDQDFTWERCVRFIRCDALELEANVS